MGPFWYYQSGSILIKKLLRNNSILHNAQEPYIYIYNQILRNDVMSVLNCEVNTCNICFIARGHWVLDIYMYIYICVCVCVCVSTCVLKQTNPWFVTSLRERHTVNSKSVGKTYLLQISGFFRIPWVRHYWMN